MVVNFLLAIFIMMVIYCFVKTQILTKDNGEEKKSFFSKESTGALKGVAIIAIAFSHICQDAPELKGLLWGGKYLYTIIFTWGGIGVAIFFLLSGYGCFISIEKANNKLTWLVRHVVKLLIYFAISFIFILLVSCVVWKNTFGVKEWALSFIMLRFPGTTSWYFKIQLLFYALLALSEKIKERQIYLLSIFVFTYTVIANYSGLPDYWWKTSFCFVVGCGLAKYKDKIILIIDKKFTKLILVLIGFGAFIYTRIDFQYILIPQLIAYVCIAGCSVIVWDWLVGKNAVFEKVGKASLAMYLVHIGVVDSIFSLDIASTDEKTIVFVIITVIGTVVCYLMSEQVNRALLARVKS